MEWFFPLGINICHRISYNIIFYNSKRDLKIYINYQLAFLFYYLSHFLFLSYHGGMKLNPSCFLIQTLLFSKIGYFTCCSYKSLLKTSIPNTFYFILFYFCFLKCKNENESRIKRGLKVFVIPFFSFFFIITRARKNQT